jgi:hypothetical protein
MTHWPPARCRCPPGVGIDDPLDPGTAGIVRDGLLIVYDPNRIRAGASLDGGRATYKRRDA